MGPASFDHEMLDGDVHLLVATGELDARSAGALRRRLDAALANGRPPRIVADLSGITHMDSSGLAALLTAHQRAADLRGGLALVITSEPIRRTLQVRGVDALFAIVWTREEALAALP
jgi:anti-anti-sigma factor